MNSGWKYAVLAAAGVSALVGGWVGLAVLGTLAACTFMLCMGLDGERGERIWIQMTLTIWLIVGLWAWSGTTECPPDAPNHCAVGR